jgi:hypothetical protein
MPGPALLQGITLHIREDSRALSSVFSMQHDGEGVCLLQVYLSLEGEAKRELQSLQHQLDAVKQVFAQMQRQQVAAGGAVG